MSNNNRRRALADIVSTDAWHDAFSAKKPKVDLHIDVAFGIGRIGGGDISDVRFRLSLRQAEIVVIIPENEPASISAGSVRRDTPNPISGEINTQIKSTSKSSAGIRGKVGISSDGVDANIRTEASALTSKDKVFTIKENNKFQGLNILQNKSPDGHHRWIITPPIEGKPLTGRAWDAAKSPVLELSDKRIDRSKGIAPTVRVEIRCLREDLLITNISLSDQNLWANIQRRKFFKNRLIAAEAAIRTMLAEEGLLCGDMADPYAQICLASTTAEES